MDGEVPHANRNDIGGTPRDVNGDGSRSMRSPLLGAYRRAARRLIHGATWIGSIQGPRLWAAREHSIVCRASSLWCPGDARTAVKREAGNAPRRR